MQLTARRRSNLILFSALIFSFSLVGVFAANAAFLITNDIYQGVAVGDIAVGGLSSAAAAEKINTVLSERMAQPVITLIYQGRTWSISAADIDLTVNTAALAQQAYDVGRNGSLIHQLRQRYTTVNQGYTIPIAFSHNDAKLQQLLMTVANTLDREPVDAAANLTSRASITIDPAVIGQKTDISKTAAMITAELQNNIPVTVTIVVDEQVPEIKDRDLAAIDGVLATYTTEFNGNNLNRSANIRLAANSINRTLVRSGEIFSFNTIVGPRLAQNGYREAPVFIDGKLLPDWGGGVCQVSSTLYNAILLADLTIEERTPHFRPPGYIPLGQDATVADNLLDFKFKNSTNNNVYILTEVDTNQVTVYVLGKLNPAAPDIRIVNEDTKVIEPATIIKQDPNLELGKQLVEVEGQKGFQVTTYRVKSRNGHEISREYLAHDDFPPEDRIIRVGSKVPNKQATMK